MAFRTSKHRISLLTLSRQPCLRVFDRRPLQPEDIVKIDITVYLDGYHGDTCRTFVVSDLDVDQPGHALVAASEAALAAGITDHAVRSRTHDVRPDRARRRPRGAVAVQERVGPAAHVDAVAARNTLQFIFLS